MAVAGLAIICCAGPLLVVGAASLGVGAWLAAHGLWLLGGLALLLAGGAVVTAYRRTQASAGSHVSQIPSEAHELSDR